VSAEDGFSYEPRPADRHTSMVSVVVPCRNEFSYLDDFLAYVFGQVLPAGVALEVIIADGVSDDGTWDSLLEWAGREPRLRLVQNPEGIVSTGLNRAIALARGDVVVRMDVHTIYAKDYIAQSLNALTSSGASCVGGPWRPLVGTSWRERAIAKAFSSPFGSGGAASRKLESSGPVDTVYLGAWWRKDLLELGGFDAGLVRNQDDELNLRIRRNGGLVWQSASIRSWYTPRSEFSSLFRQFYQYGYWKVAVIRKHRLPASPRHIVPFGFFAFVLIATLLGISYTFARWVAFALGIVYAFACLLTALFTLRRRREAPLWFGISWAFTCMHAGYALGFTMGLIDAFLLKTQARPSAIRLTRGEGSNGFRK